VVRLYSAFLAVILCGTVSAAEEVPFFPISGDLNRLRGLYTGFVKGRAGHVPDAMCLGDIVSAFSKQDSENGKFEDSSKKIAKNRLLFRFLPGLLDGRNEPSRKAIEEMGRASSMQLDRRRILSNSYLNETSGDRVSHKIIKRGLQALRVDNNCLIAEIKKEAQELLGEFSNKQAELPSVIALLTDPLDLIYQKP